MIRPTAAAAAPHAQRLVLAGPLCGSNSVHEPSMIDRAAMRRPQPMLNNYVPECIDNYYRERF